MCSQGGPTRWPVIHPRRETGKGLVQLSRGHSSPHVHRQTSQGGRRRIPTIHTPSHPPVQVGIAAACLPDQEALDAKEKYAVWKVVSELDLMLEGIKLDFDHAGLKLSSRKLAVDEAGFAELEQVPHLLRNNVLVGLSRPCGVHVHVDASYLDLNERRTLCQPLHYI